MIKSMCYERTVAYPQGKGLWLTLGISKSQLKEHKYDDNRTKDINVQLDFLRSLDRYVTIFKSPP